MVKKSYDKLGSINKNNNLIVYGETEIFVSLIS